MRTYIKICVSLAATGLLFLSAHAGAAEGAAKAKRNFDDEMKACQKRECKSMKGKDNEGYEGCMLKCQEAYKLRKKAAPVKLN